MHRPAPTNWLSTLSTPALAAGEIHVWHALLAESPCQPAWLNEEERRRLERVPDRAARQAFCANRTLLRRLLGDYLDQDPGDVTILLSEQGRPRLAEGDLDFNLSHAAGHLLLAFARGMSVGIDGETPRPLSNAQAVARRMFSTDEFEQWQREGATQAGFFARWTRMEARQKCLGEGLFARRVSPDAVSSHLFQIADMPACLAWSPRREVRIRFLRPAGL